MLSGRLAPNIISFAIPIAVTGILQQLFNAADVAVVGRFVGKEAMAAVGSNSSVIGLLVNLFVGISMGVNVVIAQASGQNNPERIKKTVHSSILVALIGGVLVTLIGEVGAAPVVKLLGVPDSVAPMAVLYLRIYFLGMPANFLYNFEQAIYRSRGNTRLPLMVLSAAGVLNVILNVFFVVVVHLSVAGVALATVISSTCSGLTLLYTLMKSDDLIHVDIACLALDGNVLKEVMRIGIPSGIQGMVFSLSNIVLQSAINSLGATIMAASSAAFNVEIFAYYLMNSFAQACTTFVGQNHGAGNNSRCREVLRKCILLDFAFTATLCLLIIRFSATLLGLFNTDPAVIAAGQTRILYVYFAYAFSLIQENFSGYLRGFGISSIPAISTVIGVCGTRITWVFTVFKRNPSFGKLMQCFPLSLFATAVVMVALTWIIAPSKKTQKK